MDTIEFEKDYAPEAWVFVVCLDEIDILTILTGPSMLLVQEMKNLPHIKYLKATIENIFHGGLTKKS